MSMKLTVAWHIAVSGKQPPNDPAERKRYLKEWQKQKRAIKRRKKS